MKIKHFAASRLRNNSYFQLQTDFKKLVEELVALVPSLEPLYQKYLPLYNKMDAAFKKIVKSAITAQINEADKARDDAWAALAQTSKIALKHFDPQVREAARHLKILIKTYGNIAKLPFKEQTAATTNILQELEGQYAQHVAKTGLLPWVVELKARNITLNNLMLDRVDEKNIKAGNEMKTAREELDNVYYEIIEQVNARAVVEGLAKYEQFIGKLNIIIAEFKLLVPKNGKKGKKETDNTQTNGGSDD